MRTAIEKIHPEEALGMKEAIVSSVERVGNETNVMATPTNEGQDVNIKTSDVASVLSTTKAIRPYGSYLEAFCFVFFMVVFLIVTAYNQGNTETFYFGDRMRDAIIDGEFMSVEMPKYVKTYLDISEYSDIWQFLEGPLIQTLYPSRWYNGVPYTADELGYVLTNNRLLGGVRIRQLRVKPNSCSVRDEYKSLISYCYGGLTSNTEDTKGFGPIVNSLSISADMAFAFAGKYFGPKKSYSDLMSCISNCGMACGSVYGTDKYRYVSEYSNQCSLSCTCFYSGQSCQNPTTSSTNLVPIYSYNWSSADTTMISSINAKFSTIPGSGYIVNLSLNGSEALSTIQKLKQDKFIDLATRAVLIEFTIFNPYIQLFNFFRCTFELPPTGGIVPQYSYELMDIYLYSSSSDNAKIFFELLLVCIVLVYFVIILRGIVQLSMVKYFRDGWRLLMACNIALFIAVIVLRLVAVNVIYSNSSGVVDVTTNLPNAEFIRRLNYQETTINAFNSIFMWLLLMKYCQVC